MAISSIRRWLSPDRLESSRRSCGRLSVTQLEDRCTPATAYLATDLAADLPGIAPFTDPTLVNAWGIALNPNGPFWVSANGADLSQVYVGTNPTSAAFRVTIPGGSPTGQVFNNSGSMTDFRVTDGTTTAAAVFIFASEAGMVTGWNPGIGVVGPPPSKAAEVGFTATDGAIYKGIAIGKNGTQNLLYLADFHNGKIDVLDGQFQKVTLGAGGFGTFADPNLPAGYAPFNVANINGKLYVSYAKQDADAEDDVRGAGNGFVDVFDLTGHLQQRLISRGRLNSPWGMVAAPAGFGDFAGAPLVGNFGDGRINAFNATTGALLGTLSESPGHPVKIDGLWGLGFGIAAGTTNTLFYAAGPDDEAHGLFGKITANPAGTNPVTAVLTAGDLVITGSRNGDDVSVSMKGNQIVVRAEGDFGKGHDDDGEVIGRFDAGAVTTIRFNGLAGNDEFEVSQKVTTTVIADGGAGNDKIKFGGGPGVALGGPGDDNLLGGKGRALLIGGDGRDHLNGQQGDDILIGGRTAHDGSPTALLQILNTWAGSGTYTERVAAIRAGTGGVPKLDSTTVLDDGTRDDLIGGAGLDWFFASPLDRVHGRKPGEQVN